MRTRIGSHFLRCALATLCLAGAASSKQAQAVEPIAMDQFIEFQADELTYDSRDKIIRATGNVVAVQGGRRLLAELSHLQRTAERRHRGR